MSDAVMVPELPINDPTNPAHRLADDLRRGRIPSYAADDVRAVLTMLAASPPSVSTDKGSRPQEAVPTEQADRPVLARHIDEWHEDMGDVLWWTNPVREAPYVGSPLCLGRAYALSIGDFTASVDLGGWPGYHSWWTPLPALPVFTPQPADGCSSNEGAG